MVFFTFLNFGPNLATSIDRDSNGSVQFVGFSRGLQNTFSVVTLVDNEYNHARSPPASGNNYVTCDFF
jgi:hypothetical protein